MTRLRELFGIDTRSLAVFRIGLGAVIVFDHLFRARFLTFEYTDAGYLPRILIGTPPPFFQLHLANGSFGWQASLFAAGILLGLLLILGWRTRIVTPLCWLVVGSLHYRNRYLLDAGDLLLRTMLLWSIFLPLGARWSLDAKAGRGGNPPSGVVCSLASAVLLVQFFVLYFHAGVLKSGPEWRSEGTAVAMVLGQSYWAGVGNDLLLRFPTLLKWMTPIVVWFETLGPLLLFSPWRTGPLRVLGILAFWAFQASLKFGIELNFFPIISSVATLPFLPSWLWERLGLGPPDAGPVGAPAPRPDWRARAETAVVAVLATLGTLQFFDTLGVISARDTANRIFEKTGMLQRWAMYAPGPVPFDPAFTLVATYADGSRDDALAVPTPPGGARWEKVRRMHDTYRFKAFWEKNMVAPGQVLRTRIYLGWLCRQWNAVAPPDRQMREVELVLTRTLLKGPDAGKSDMQLVGEPHRCGKPSLIPTAPLPPP